MSEKITCFKAYDVRGQIPNQLNEDIVYRIGRAFVEFIKPKKVIIGRDIRESSQLFSDALAKGLTDGGADVYDIGLCGTEEVYFATFHEEMDGGIMVTASHNPRDYNGLKFVRDNARPISGDTGLQDIRKIAENKSYGTPERQGTRTSLNTDAAFVEHLWRYVDKSRLRPLRIVVNAGNGGAGKIIDLIEPHMPFEFIKVHHEADGTFPNGIPNPLLIENRNATSEAVLDAGADLGVAWDGDYDRCFLFDERGEFIEGYYIVGLLAASFLANSSNKGDAVVHDPRLVWNTISIVEGLGGKAVQSKSGHAFIKEKMREVDAVYGGEMSAHHYFRDFAYCDSGMIPWLLVAQMVSEEGRPLSAMVADRIAEFPSSGEINRRVADPQATIARVRDNYLSQALKEDTTDGISMEFTDWRFNLRASNTEPLIRLNVESRGDKGLMEAKTKELLDLMASE